MTSSNDSTTLICLFHHDGQARAALEDLYATGIPRSAISVIGGEGSRGAATSGLQTLGIPERDLKHLRDGIEEGGTVVAVSATAAYVEAVEEIFERHQATKVDEDDEREEAREAAPAAGRSANAGAAWPSGAGLASGASLNGSAGPNAGAAANASAAADAGAASDAGARRVTGADRMADAGPAGGRAAFGSAPKPERKSERKFAGETAIPVVEEQLQVGKRTVDQGGVRIYRRIVEIPAEETIKLREEHVVVERNAVDRAATPAEMEGRGNRSIELTETAEEAVITKNARVVEEVMVGKETAEHTEHIRETVRRTEVEVEELPANDRRMALKGSY